MHATGAADSNGFVARLYHVHDIFEASFDGRTFCSQQIHKHTEEGSRHREQTIRFDYARGKALRDDLNLKNNERTHLENAIPPCALDVLSALFYAASLPLAEGSTYVFPVNDGGKTVDLQVAVLGRERLKTDAGVFETIRVQPKADSEIIKKHGSIWIWYSDDGERLPVQMRGHMGWGTLTMTLDRIERSAKP